MHGSRKLPKGAVPLRKKVGSSSAAVHSSSTLRRNDTVEKIAYAMPYTAKEQSAMEHFMSLHIRILTWHCLDLQHPIPCLQPAWVLARCLPCQVLPCHVRVTTQEASALALPPGPPGGDCLTEGETPLGWMSREQSWGLQQRTGLLNGAGGA